MSQVYSANQQTSLAAVDTQRKKNPRFRQFLEVP